MLSTMYKEKLNILITYYRKNNLKKTNAGEWQQNTFYLDEQNLSICSSKTYNAMEQNKKVVNEEIYRFAAKKLGKEILEKKEWNAILYQLEKELLFLMNRKKEKEIITVLNKAMIDLQEANTYMYYHEIILHC